MQVWYVRTPEIFLPLASRIVMRTLNLPFGRPLSRTGARSRLPRTTLTFLPLTRTVADSAFLPFGTRIRIRNARRDLHDFCCTPATPPAGGGVVLGGVVVVGGGVVAFALYSSAPMSTWPPITRASPL